MSNIVPTDEEGLPYNEEDLPYKGDLQLAFRSGASHLDIRTIIRWRNKYDKKEEKSEETKEEDLSDEAKACNNIIDYISQEAWSKDNKPNFFIRYMDDEENLSKQYCYNKDNLINLINKAGNLATAWIPRHPDFILDDNGFVLNDVNRKHAVSHSMIEYYVIIPENRYINYYSYTRAVYSSNNRFIAVPIYDSRVSNIYGSCGVSESHGQVPGETIYYLIRDTENISYDEIYVNLMKLKRSIYFSAENVSLKTLRNIQEEFEISRLDQEYYWLRYPWCIVRERNNATDFIPPIVLNNVNNEPIQAENIGMTLTEEVYSLIAILDTDYSLLKENWTNNSASKIGLANSLYRIYRKEKSVVLRNYQVVKRENAGDRPFYSYHEAIRDIDKIERSIGSYVAYEHYANDMIGFILYSIHYLLSEKFTLWIGKTDDTIVECVFASSFYMQYYRNVNVIYTPITSLNQISSAEVSNIIRSIRDNEYFYKALLLQLETASLIRQTGLYIDDIMIIIYTSVYVVNVHNLYPVFQKEKFIGFSSKEILLNDAILVDIHYVSSTYENVLINAILRSHMLFSTLLRLHRNIDICRLIIDLKNNINYGIESFHNNRKYVRNQYVPPLYVEDINDDALLVMAIFDMKFRLNTERYISDTRVILNILKQNGVLLQ